MKRDVERGTAVQLADPICQVMGAVAAALCFSFLLLGAQQESWKGHSKEGGQFHRQGKLAQAEQAYLAALQNAHHLPSDDRDFLTIQNNLATVYVDQGRFDEAEALFVRVLSANKEFRERPQVASTLNNLAEIYRIKGRLAEAETVFQRALAVWENTVGLGHPAAAATVQNLGRVAFDRRQYARAEQLYREALAIREKALGPEDEAVAYHLEWSRDRLCEPWTRC